MTSHRQPTRRPRKRAQDEPSPAQESGAVTSEIISEALEADTPTGPIAVDRPASSKAARSRIRYRVCPKCQGHFVRMHRRLADRLLSLFNPVRRYRCTNHLCQYEAILWKRPSLTQRPIVAAAGLAGAALAGALVMGIGLYVSSDDSTRAQVRDVYTNAMHADAISRPDATLASPVSQHVPEPKYETASMFELNSKSGDLTVDFMPPVPTLAPGANPEAGRPATRE